MFFGLDLSGGIGFLSAVLFVAVAIGACVSWQRSSAVKAPAIDPEREDRRPPPGYHAYEIVAPPAIRPKSLLWTTSWFALLALAILLLVLETRP